MTVTIRPRREEDIPALAAVLVRVHELDGYPVEGVADPEAWLRHEHEIQSWVADYQGEPVGQITLTRADPDPDADTARQWEKQTGGDAAELAIPARLFVDPEHRGSGIGRLLMQSASKFARAERLAIAFDVMLKDRTAIRLYESLGANRIAEVEHHYGAGRTEPAAVYVLGNP